MNIQILIVEDDSHIREMAKKFLLKAGYSVDTCEDGNMALELLYSKNYHLVILDIMLPGSNGHKVLKEFREMYDTPVLMMAALSDDENQLTAYNNETDDYIVKPFSMQILVKRAEALLRRSGVLKKEIKAGKLTLLSEIYEVRYDSKKIQLSPKEFEILHLLVQNRHRIVLHETLLIRIWGYDFDGNEGIIHASIKKLRDNLPENIIKTVKGVGYRLEVTDDEA